jgi:hypothetical protein
VLAHYSHLPGWTEWKRKDANKSFCVNCREGKCLREIEIKCEE